MSNTKIWITKYALTQGILVFDEHSNSHRQEEGINGVTVVDANGMNGWASYYGRDWHLSLGSALIRAEAMRVAKIASLREQIRKLEALRFDGGGK